MSKIQEAIKLLNERITISKVSADNENYLIQMSIKEAEDLTILLESILKKIEPEPGDLYINTDGIRRTARSVKDGQGTRTGSMAKMLIDCCDFIDRLTAENQKLRMEIREAKQGTFGFMIHSYETLQQGMNRNYQEFHDERTRLNGIIDRLTAENEKYRQANIKCAQAIFGLEDTIDRLTAEIKTKDEALKRIKNYGDESLSLRMASEIAEQALKGGDK